MDGFEGLLIGLAVVFAVVPLLALLILVVAGGRGEPDPTGKRSFALYLGTVCFVALFTALVASTLLVASVTEKIKDEESTDESAEEFEFEDDIFPDEEFEDDFDEEFEEGFGGEDQSDVTENDRILQGVVRSGLILGAAVGVLVFHARRRRDLEADPDAAAGTAAWRVDRSYQYVVCTTAVLIFLFAAGVGAYDLFRVAAPGVFASGDDTVARKEGLQSLLTLAWLAIGAGAIFWWFWGRVRPGAGPAAAPAGKAPAKTAPARPAPTKKAPAKKSR